MQRIGNRGSSATTTGGETWTDLVPAVAVAVVAAAGGAVAFYAPPARGEMGVVFPPWVPEVEAARIVIEAGGRLASTTRFPNILIVTAADEGFGTRVRGKGAWLTIAARGLCGPLPEEGKAS